MARCQPGRRVVRSMAQMAKLRAISRACLVSPRPRKTLKGVLLKPLFDRPVSPEERAACDAVADEIARLQAEAMTTCLATLDHALAVLAREGDTQAAHSVLAQEAAALRAT